MTYDGIVLAFVWRVRVKARKTSVKIVVRPGFEIGISRKNVRTEF